MTNHSLTCGVISQRTCSILFIANYSITVSPMWRPWSSHHIRAVLIVHFMLISNFSPSNAIPVVNKFADLWDSILPALNKSQITSVTKILYVNLNWMLFLLFSLFNKKRHRNIFFIKVKREFSTTWSTRVFFKKSIKPKRRRRKNHVVL